MFDIHNMFRNYKQLPDRPNICSKKINQIKRNLRINSTLQFVSFFTIFPYGNEYNLASNLLFKYRGHRIRSGGHLFTLVLLRYQRHTFRNEKKSTVIRQKGILWRIHFSSCVLLTKHDLLVARTMSYFVYITIQILFGSNRSLKNANLCSVQTF